MEYKKAIEIIQTGLAWANWTNEQKEAFLIAEEAVEKQIPQGVGKYGNGFMGVVSTLYC